MYKQEFNKLIQSGKMDILQAIDFIVDAINNKEIEPSAAKKFLKLTFQEAFEPIHMRSFAKALGFLIPPDNGMRITVDGFDFLVWRDEEDETITISDLRKEDMGLEEGEVVPVFFHTHLLKELDN